MEVMKDAIFGSSTAVNTVFFAKCRDLAVIFCVFVIYTNICTNI